MCLREACTRNEVWSIKDSPGAFAGTDCIIMVMSNTWFYYFIEYDMFEYIAPGDAHHEKLKSLDSNAIHRTDTAHVNCGKTLTGAQVPVGRPPLRAKRSRRTPTSANARQQGIYGVQILSAIVLACFVSSTALMNYPQRKILPASNCRCATWTVALMPNFLHDRCSWAFWQLPGDPFLTELSHPAVAVSHETSFAWETAIISRLHDI